LFTAFIADHHQITFADGNDFDCIHPRLL
jgi:hypothetical protein